MLLFSWTEYWLHAGFPKKTANTVVVQEMVNALKAKLTGGGS